MPDDRQNKQHMSDSFAEMKELVEKMMLDPERAKKAVHDRNIIIKSLKADIEHRKVVFGEIEARYDMMAEKLADAQANQKSASEATENAANELLKLRQELQDAQKKLDDVMSLNELLLQEKEATIKEKNESVRGRLLSISYKLPKVVGSVMRFFILPPVSTYMSLALFCILFTASIIGWQAVYAALHPLFKLISSLFGN